MEWPDRPVDLMDDTLDKFTMDHSVALVDFWGPSCAPCKMIAPVLEQLAGEMKGKVAIGKMDVTKNTKIAMSMGLRSIPTIAFYKSGKLVKIRIGFLSKSKLIGEIREIL
ncbi:MAG: thioredoxin domain-containing protein [Candidatus Thermoplasmatota archaeon]|nr:thioredoxin domain-containing protein [Candidatus Thermoplasmatota archaeon]